jgi:hypothetical protein
MTGVIELEICVGAPIYYKMLVQFVSSEFGYSLAVLAASFELAEKHFFGPSKALSNKKPLHLFDRVSVEETKKFIKLKLY